MTCYEEFCFFSCLFGDLMFNVYILQKKCLYAVVAQCRWRWFISVVVIEALHPNKGMIDKARKYEPYLFIIYFWGHCKSLRSLLQKKTSINCEYAFSFFYRQHLNSLFSSRHTFYLKTISQDHIVNNNSNWILPRLFKPYCLSS